MHSDMKHLIDLLNSKAELLDHVAEIRIFPENTYFLKFNLRSSTFPHEKSSSIGRRMTDLITAILRNVFSPKNAIWLF